MSYRVIQYSNEGRNAFDNASRFLFTACSHAGAYYRGYVEIRDNGNAFVYGIFRVHDGVNLNRNNRIFEMIANVAGPYIERREA